MTIRAQERKFYDADGNPTGTAQVLIESKPGSGNFDTINNSPPDSGSRTSAIFGANNRVQYIPEGKRASDPTRLTNMNQQLFFHPNFAFNVDFWGWLPIADRLKFGINSFTQFAITEAQRADIPPKSGMYEVPEAAVSGNKEGYGFYNCSLSQWEAHVQGSFEGVGNPTSSLKNFGRLVFNFESSQFWGPGNNGVLLPGFRDVAGNCNSAHYPNWDLIKNDPPLLMESLNQVMTWGELAALGQDVWVQEVWLTRRINRMAVVLDVARQKSIEGAEISYGTAIFQGYPTTDKSTRTSLFIEGNCDVRFVKCTDATGADTGATGDGSGNVVLNGSSYTLRGTHYNKQGFDQGYWYKYGGDFSPTDNQEIFIDKKAGTQNYPYLWSREIPGNYTAEEKGFWQQNRRVQAARLETGVPKGIMRQTEIIYEGNTRVPFPELQVGEPPKLWHTPAWAYSSVATWRFLRGNDDPGNGYYSFPIVSPNEVVLPPNNAVWARWDHHWHSYNAMIQARMDLQRLERWFTGSSLIENPDVKIGASGSWQNYDGVSAYADGNPNAQKPCSSIRYKEVSDGVQVEIMIGMGQGYGVSRTDEVRAPGGTLLGGNSFKITYSGPQTRIISAFVPTGTTNTSIDLGNFSVPEWEPAGYAGRTQFT